MSDPTTRLQRSDRNRFVLFISEHIKADIAVTRTLFYYYGTHKYIESESS